MPSTDETGEANFSVTIDKLPANTHLLEAKIAVRMAEPGRRAVEHTVTLPVTASGNMVGIKPLFTGHSLGDGATGHSTLVVVAPNGAAVAQSGLHYELLESIRVATSTTSAITIGISNRSKRRRVSPTATSTPARTSLAT